MPAKPSKTSNQAIALTPNFTLAEMIHSPVAIRLGIENTPNSPTVMANLYRLAALMEGVRAVCKNKPVFIISAYRSPALNVLMDGRPDTPHLIGTACDFTVPSFGTPAQVAKAIQEAGLPVGELAWGSAWVHISLAD